MMDITYDYVWNEIIQPDIEILLDEIYKDDIDMFQVSIQNEKILKKKIYSNYEKKKDRLKELYHFDNGDVDRRIDIHKIAACFAAVLIEDRVFSFIIKEGLTDDIFLLNAKLAYNVSTDIIFMSLVYHYIKNGEKDIVNKILKNGKLYVPITSNGHDEYNIGRQKTIALNDIYGNEFDILTYSDMMFWLEHYNRQILEHKIELSF